LAADTGYIHVFSDNPYADQSSNLSAGSSAAYLSVTPRRHAHSMPTTPLDPGSAHTARVFATELSAARGSAPHTPGAMAREVFQSPLVPQPLDFGDSLPSVPPPPPGGSQAGAASPMSPLAAAGSSIKFPAFMSPSLSVRPPPPPPPSLPSGGLQQSFAQPWALPSPPPPPPPPPAQVPASPFLVPEYEADSHPIQPDSGVSQGLRQMAGLSSLTAPMNAITMPTSMMSPAMPMRPVQWAQSEHSLELERGDMQQQKRLQPASDTMDDTDDIITGSTPPSFSQDADVAPRPRQPSLLDSSLFRKPLPLQPASASAASAPFSPLASFGFSTALSVAPASHLSLPPVPMSQESAGTQGSGDASENDDTYTRDLRSFVPVATSLCVGASLCFALTGMCCFHFVS
jgi:hypothetical protein